MKRATVLLAALFLSMLLPQAAAQPWTLKWESNLGPGYITTSPLVDEEHIYVRTSGFWTGEERPEVLAFSHDGEQRWTHRSQTTTQHDMAPLMRVEAGSGPCGAWPDLLLVGWANGSFTSLHPSNGTLYWHTNSPVDGWGITGASMVDGDRVVVPTRTGLMRLCLSTGVPDFQTELGNGWRNGVTLHDGAYWLGDEMGRLWAVETNGTVRAMHNLSGSLRHAPVNIGSALLLHVQEETRSRLLSFNSTSELLTELAVLGRSPAIPLVMGSSIVFADSGGLTSVLCNPACVVVDTYPSKVNGELGRRSSTQLFAPVNTESGGWLSIDVVDNGTFEGMSMFRTPYDGYGTSAPAWTPTGMYLGNDAGVLMAYEFLPGNGIEASLMDPQQDGAPLIGLAAVTLCLVGAAWLGNRGRTTDAWRVATLMAVAVAVLMLPDLSASWSEWLVEDEASADETAWDPSWPDVWLGTQVVVFDLPDQTVVVGGLLGHQTVWDLTQAAAKEHNLSIDTESTGLGLYLVAIEGVEGTGWEYTINNQRGVFAVDDAEVSSSLVLRWHLA